MYCMNKFFDGEFLNYGLRVMNYSEQAQEDRVDPMVYVFPRVTKCIFHKYGNNVTKLTINLFNQLNFVTQVLLEASRNTTASAFYL